MTDIAKYNQIALFMKDLSSLLSDNKKLQEKNFRLQQQLDAVTLDRDDLVEEIGDNYNTIESYRNRADDLEIAVEERKQEEAFLKAKIARLTEEARTWKEAYQGQKEEIAYYRKLEEEQKMKPKEEVGDDEFINAKRNKILAMQAKKKKEIGQDQYSSDEEDEAEELKDHGTRKLYGKMVDNLIQKDPKGFDADFVPIKPKQSMFSDDESSGDDSD